MTSLNHRPSLSHGRRSTAKGAPSLRAHPCCVPGCHGAACSKARIWRNVCLYFSGTRRNPGPKSYCFDGDCPTRRQARSRAARAYPGLFELRGANHRWSVGRGSRAMVVSKPAHARLAGRFQT
jgi:hypothetical protein